MKVAHFIDSGGLYGAEKMLISLCDSMSQYDVHTTIFSIRKSSVPLPALNTEAKSHGIQVQDVVIDTLHPKKVAQMMSDALTVGEYDICHTHGYKFNVSVGCYRQLFQIPVVTTVHGYIPRSIASKGYIYQKADQIMCKRLSHTIYVNTIDRTKYGSDNSSTILNGINPKGRPQKNQSYGASRYCYFGRLCKGKGLQELIEAFNELSNKHSGISLDIYGDGELRDALTLSTNEHIKLCGYAQNVGRIITNYDALILPSYSEGLPITILEAAVGKIPIITTQVGAIPDVLGINHPYYIQKIRSSNSIRDTLLRFFEDSPLNRESSTHYPYEVVMNKLTTDNMATQYLDVYGSLI